MATNLASTFRGALPELRSPLPLASIRHSSRRDQHAKAANNRKTDFVSPSLARARRCTGFPFTLGLAHPQYLGSVMTAYGLVLATCTDAHAAAGYGGLAHAQALLYVYMSYVEHNL